MNAVEGLDLPALEKFFDERVIGFAGWLTADLVSGGRSNLTYRLADGVTEWILRRPPLGTLTPSAHDMGREFRIVAALHGSGVPVAPPTVVASAEDSPIGVPFAVVEYVPGRVVRTGADLDGWTDDEVRACGFGLVDTLAALHAVDPDAVGLGDFGRPHGYLARQVRRWREQWERVRTRDLPDVDALYERLADHTPAESGTAVVHGDYRVDNVLLDPADPARVVAVVDWEMSTLGDPLADLALHLVYGDPDFAPVLGGSAASTSPRFPAPDELVARYAVATGADTPDLGFHLALAYFKTAVIAEGIHERFLRGDTRGEGFGTVGDAVAPLAASGLRRVGRPSARVD